MEIVTIQRIMKTIMAKKAKQDKRKEAEKVEDDDWSDF